MKFEKIKATLILLIAPLTVFADSQNEYSFDVTTSYSREEGGGSVDVNGWNTSFQYYWNPVIYSDSYPNKEAVFINRLGSINNRGQTTIK